MQVSKLTRSKFHEVQRGFFNTVRQSPTCCEIKETTVSATSLSYSEFVGESDRTVKAYSIKCLFHRIVNNHDRDKFGLSKDVSAIIYTSPTILSAAMGKWQLDDTKIRVTLLGREYLVSAIFYSGHIEEYNSCISVELRLKDVIHAG
jgi:hypothetical protein